MPGPAAMTDSCLNSSIAEAFAPHTYTRLQASHTPRITTVTAVKWHSSICTNILTDCSGQSYSLCDYIILGSRAINKWN